MGQPNTQCRPTYLKHAAQHAGDCLRLDGNGHVALGNVTGCPISAKLRQIPSGTAAASRLAPPPSDELSHVVEAPGPQICLNYVRRHGQNASTSMRRDTGATTPGGHAALFRHVTAAADIDAQTDCKKRSGRPRDATLSSVVSSGPLVMS